MKKELIKNLVSVISIAAMVAMLVFLLALFFSLFFGVASSSLSTISIFFIAGFLVYLIVPEIGLVFSVIGGYLGIAIATILINVGILGIVYGIATTVFVNTMVGIIPFTIGYLLVMKLKGDKISWMGRRGTREKAP